MRKPYLSLSPKSLADALFKAKRAKDVTELITIMAQLRKEADEVFEDEDLPEDINELKNKIDAALTESAKDDDLDQEAEEHDVIMTND